MEARLPLSPALNEPGMNTLPRWWLCLSALVPFAADVGITLAGQPKSYWTGDYTTAHEGNPLARWPLAYHPAAFVVAAVFAAAAYITVLVWGASWLALVLAFALVVGIHWLFVPGYSGWAGQGTWLRRFSCCRWSGSSYFPGSGQESVERIINTDRLLRLRRLAAVLRVLGVGTRLRL